MNKQELFKSLPESVKTEIKTLLCCYNNCHVERYPDGRHEVSTSVCLHNGVYPDFIGSFKSEDVLTVDEWKEGFEQEFGYKPNVEFTLGAERASKFQSITL